MFEPLLAPLTWGYATRKLELGRISGAGWLAARSAPEVMRLCSNPVGHRPAPGVLGQPRLTRSRGIPRGPRNVLEQAGSVSTSNALRHVWLRVNGAFVSGRRVVAGDCIAHVQPRSTWLIVRFTSWRSWRLVRCRGRGPLRLCIGGLVDVSSGCEVSMNYRNDRRSFAAGGCDAFHRAGAGVADGEHAGYGGGEAFGGEPVGP